MVKISILLPTGRIKTQGNSRDSLVLNFYEMERKTLFFALILSCLPLNTYINVVFRKES